MPAQNLGISHPKSELYHSYHTTLVGYCPSPAPRLHSIILYLQPDHPLNLPQSARTTAPAVPLQHTTLSSASKLPLILAIFWQSSIFSSLKYQVVMCTHTHSLDNTASQDWRYPRLQEKNYSTKMSCHDCSSQHRTPETTHCGS